MNGVGVVDYQIRTNCSVIFSGSELLRLTVSQCRQTRARLVWATINSKCDQLLNLKI